jgi:HNH endonuclease
MDEQLRVQVRQRAADCCEYCGLPQSALPFARFQVDHIIAEQHNGPTELFNLALCCSRCNLSKGPNLSGIDSETGAIVTLFNPRTDNWHDHFENHGVFIVGRTPAGRATVHVLNMNEDRRVKLRASLLQSRRPRRRL